MRRRSLMPTLTREIREQLMTCDPEYQKLAQEHLKYETQLEQLCKSAYLNLEDLQQKVTLKKLKLRVKDAMERHLAQRLNRYLPRAIDPPQMRRIRDRMSANAGWVWCFFFRLRTSMVKDGYKFAAAPMLLGARRWRSTGMLRACCC